VIRKLSTIIPELLSYENFELIVADSGSEDGTGELARNFLQSSELEFGKWRVEEFSIPGKNIAINGVIGKIDSDVVIISDADANVSPGWLDVVLQRLSEGDVGVVSGLEKVSKTSDFNSYYRTRSNRLRISESLIDSTPVLEGSLLAWKTSALGEFRISEEVNADDAQIGLEAINRGYRSIVDPRISFSDFETKDRTIGESIRRSQGLSIVLSKNIRLGLKCPRKDARRAMFHAFFLYVIFPWSVLIFAINSVAAFMISPGVGDSWGFYSIFVITIVLITHQGRSLAIGVAISIIAHTQAILGKRYNRWDPVR